MVSVPRTVLRYVWCAEQGTLHSISDVDFDGRKRTARSTSGGLMMFGCHYITSWRSAQKSVPLSSGEAGLTTVVKRSYDLVGFLQFA